MQRLNKVLFIVLITAFHLQSQPQYIGQWKSFTDMKSVRCATCVNSTIWAATGGGIFVFDTVHYSFTKFTNVDGLDTNDTRTIAYDGSNRIWVGGSGGWVNVYDLNIGEWRTIIDINQNPNPNKGIQSFFFKGDTVFITTEFGVSVFKISRWEFGDTYSNLGFSTPPKVLCMALQDDRIWIGTDSGLTTASLSAPAIWTTYTSIPGLSSKMINSLAVFNDTLVIGTNSGAAYFLNGIFGVVSSLSGKAIRELRVDKGKLLVLSVSGSTFTVESLDAVLNAPQTIAFNSDVQGVSLVPASSLWISTATKGLAKESSAGWQYIYPNGPNSRFFNSLVVDANGVLWCGSGEGTQAGFYRYNPSIASNSQWKNFTSNEYPIMRQFVPPSNYQLFDDYHSVSLGANGSVWVGSWGDGFVEVVGDAILGKYNHHSTPSLPGAIASDTNFVVSGGCAVDNQNRVWVVHRNESGGRSLMRFDNSTSGTFFDNKRNPTWGWFHGVVIDQNNTKWMTSTTPFHIDQNGNGLFYFNEDKIIPGTQAYDGWGNISDMPDNKVFSLALDLEGELWVGLGLGVVIIPDPLNPNLRRTSFPLYQQTVQAIAVDAINNKWIGTREGVFVVNPDGTELLQTYNVFSTNKRLLANDIRAITIDQKRGIAYFGTEQGLSSLAIEPIQTNRSYSKLEIGPNPFVLPSNQPLMIRNLVANSTIKVLTVNGSLVTQFEAQGGGRAFWDGRNKNGVVVPSGIYFIVAFSDNGTKTVTGKVVVIRR